MNLAKTLLMSLLLIAGGAYIYVYELSPSEESETEKPLFPDVSDESIQKLTLAGAEESFSLERIDGNWQLTEPLKAAADPAAVDNIVYALDSMLVRNSIENSGEEALAGFGLAEPELSVEFTAGATTRKISFGKQHPFSGRRYARLNGEGPVLLIDESSYQSLKKRRFDVRDKQIVSLKPEEISKLTLQRRLIGEMQLERKGEGWEVSAFGDQRIADTELVERIVKSVSGIRANEFVDEPGEDLARFGLDDPVVVVELGKEGGEKPAVTLKIGEVGSGPDERKMYVQRDDSARVYGVGKRFYSKLLQPAHYYRDSTPFDEIDVGKIKSVQIESLDDPLSSFTIRTGTIPGAGTVWGVVDFSGRPDVADEKSVLDFLEALLHMRALYLSPEERRGMKGSLMPVKSFDIIFVGDSGEDLSYRLLVAGEIESAQAASQENSAPAPRYGTLKLGVNDDAVPVILRGERWERLNKSREDFLPQQEESVE